MVFRIHYQQNKSYSKCKHQKLTVSKKVFNKMNCEIVAFSTNSNFLSGGGAADTAVIGGGVYNYASPFTCSPAFCMLGSSYSIGVAVDNAVI